MRGRGKRRGRGGGKEGGREALRRGGVQRSSAVPRSLDTLGESYPGAGEARGEGLQSHLVPSPSEGDRHKHIHTHTYTRVHMDARGPWTRRALFRPLRNEWIVSIFLLSSEEKMTFSGGSLSRTYRHTRGPGKSSRVP